jgi:hypothetical protein
MALPSSPERQTSLKPAEAPSAVVSQPVKVDSHLGNQLGSFLEDINKISESTGSGPGEQWSGGGTGSAMTQTSGGSTPVASVRDQAIANLPSPKIMQKQLEVHIKTEIKNLRKQAKTIARISQPGGAYKLNQLYTRIHHLNALLGELLSSSVEVLKRLFIRVFVDKQTVL